MTETDLQTAIPREATRVLEPYGWLHLDEALASDLSVVNAAKVSFAKRVETLTAKEEGLINFLMKNHHTSPLEHGYFRFIVHCPIAVAREWMRHRTWSYNEFSTRYSEVTQDEFAAYIPTDLDNMRSQVGKPGAYTFEPLEGAKAAASYQLMDKAHQVKWVDGRDKCCVHAKW